jgi:hypothetical protein
LTVQQERANVERSFKILAAAARELHLFSFIERLEAVTQSLVFQNRSSVFLFHFNPFFFCVAVLSPAHFYHNRSLRKCGYCSS